MKLQNLIPILIGIVCIGLLPRAQALSPAPDGGYPGGNTAEGQNALFSLTTGGYNTGVGFLSLRSDTAGAFNTAIGAGTLLANTGDSNTATGAGALFSNTTGPSNTANGAFALFSNTTGGFNTANGYQALLSNTTGYWHSAFGAYALFSNTVGVQNTATGWAALFHNTEGGSNTAAGVDALFSNITGSGNTAIGDSALYENTAGFNTANGYQALLLNTTGAFNTAIGFAAGNFITGDGNVCIGANVSGVDGAYNATWIRNVYDSLVSGRAVYVDSNNKIGTLSSSRRYKDEIRPMSKASEAILSLRPVSFRYRKQVDPTRSLSFGLIAEEVAQVDPDLVTPDRDGKPETVRYEAVNAMLLNEFLKEHRKVEQQEGKIQEQDCKMQEQAASIAALKSTVDEQQKGIEVLTAQQQKGMEALVARLNEQAAQIQEVSDQLAAASPSRGGLNVSKFATGRIRRGGPAPQIVLNNQ